jgi:hypothetical protein
VLETGETKFVIFIPDSALSVASFWSQGVLQG